MTRLREVGMVRWIGVANGTAALLRQAIEYAGAPIACNQIENHALIDQAPMLDWMRAHGRPVVAYVPLARQQLSFCRKGSSTAVIARSEATRQSATARTLDQIAASRSSSSQ